MTATTYDLVVAGPAAATLARKPPEAVAAAVIELITGPLLEAPRRIGVPLRDELDGLCSARRGTCRIVYRIDDTERIVEILRISHRRDAYRPAGS
ncbi:type II toxin-antitoxin system RelE family toxin [Candidatus Poriferisodalis sp.]|uniref:type II toxin-antitoxin system RelE family toxin n=1 Tax=Candidatus Poriferisodalis sp. TaxID=3101277 RepID=UPI003B01C9D9